MNAMRIYLIRHGETQWNKEGIFRGLSDVPLNESGKAHARALGRYFSHIPLQAIYASRLSRAMDTAQAIANGQKRAHSVFAEEGFVDIHRGTWEGLKHRQAERRYPKLYRQWFKTPQAVKFPGGNSLNDVQRAARAALDRIHHQRRKGDVAIVSHHIVIRALLCSLLDLKLSHFRRFEVFPGSISEMRYEYGHWVLYGLNDISHLGKGVKS